MSCFQGSKLVCGFKVVRVELNAVESDEFATVVCEWSTLGEGKSESLFTSSFTVSFVKPCLRSVNHVPKNQKGEPFMVSLRSRDTRINKESIKSYLLYATYVALNSLTKTSCKESNPYAKLALLYKTLFDSCYKEGFFKSPDFNESEFKSADFTFSTPKSYGKLSSEKYFNESAKRMNEIIGLAFNSGVIGNDLRVFAEEHVGKSIS